MNSVEPSSLGEREPIRKQSAGEEGKPPWRPLEVCLYDPRTQGNDHWRNLRTRIFWQS
jgi:hypothetical protein